MAEPCAICGDGHLFDLREVRRAWWPAHPRCLIIGESPGAPGGAYFYDPVPAGRDPVTVRRQLLAGLERARLLPTNTLEAFRAEGFAFDHAVRCQLATARMER